MTAKLPVKHIGILRAICDGRRRANLRADLGVARYRQLGRTELLTDQDPYRICTACIKRIASGNLR